MPVVRVPLGDGLIAGDRGVAARCDSQWNESNAVLSAMESERLRPRRSHRRSVRFRWLCGDRARLAILKAFDAAAKSCATFGGLAGTRCVLPGPPSSVVRSIVSDETALSPPPIACGGCVRQVAPALQFRSRHARPRLTPWWFLIFILRGVALCATTSSTNAMRRFVTASTPVTASR